MSANPSPRRFLRLSLVISLPILALAFLLLPPQIARAGGEVTDCSNDTDLHAKLAGGGLVTFNCGSAPVTITLTSTDLPGSHISITQTTSISGGGLLTLQGNGNARIFNVDGSSLSLEGLTITGGRALQGSPNNNGGAIYIINGGVVSVTDSRIFDNRAQYGGAIRAAEGLLTVTNSSLFNNQAEYGGAIYVMDLSPESPPINTATIVNSAVTSNTATHGDGGAVRIWNSRLTLANSTLSNNRALEIAGSGIRGDGGGIAVGGSETGSYGLVVMTNTTIYSNSASINGGGVHIDDTNGSARVKNSIIANNAATDGANCSTIILDSDGHNLASDDTCDFDASGDLTNTNPLLGPLAPNGGSTLTHAPLPGSPAINAADNAACAAPPVSSVDQRGVARPQGVTCDIGAVEATINLSLGKSSTSQGGDPVHPTERITYTIVVTNTGSLTATTGLMSDTLPANTTFVPDSISLTPPDAGTLGTAPPVLASDLSLAPNQPVTATFAVTVNVPLADGTLITNTASLTSAESLSPVSDTITDIVRSAPSWLIRKRSQDANDGELSPGDTISYTIVVSNSGTENATGAVISDTLPANTTFVPGTISLTPSDAGTPGTEPPTLASDLAIDVSEVVTVAFAATVDLPLPDGTLITNTASITSTETPIPVSDGITDTVRSATSLAIRKSSQDMNGGALSPGDTISYTIVVSNSGTANATGAVISDTLPANTTFVPGSISLTPLGAGTPGTLPPTLASDLAIDVGEAVTTTFAVTVNLPLADGTLITNTASLTSTESPSPVSDTITDIVRSAPSWVIRKRSEDTNGGELNPGDTISYTIVVSNSGTENATGAVISDTLPANTTFVPGSISLTPSDAGTPGTEPPTLASDLAIDVSEVVTVAFAVTVDLPLPDGTDITNTASIISTETPSPVSDSVTDTVRSATSLAISKRSEDTNDAPLSPGDTLVYTIVVSNSGTASATGAVISDTVPANTTFVPGSISLTPSDAGTPGTEPPTLASGLTVTPSQPVTAAFAVTVDLPLPDDTLITNIASFTSTETPSPISARVNNTVTSAPSLTIRKSSQDADGGTLSPGDTISYTIVVENNGTETATGAVISDTLPANTTFVPGSISLTPPGAGTLGTVPPILASDLIITPGQPVVAGFAVTVNIPLDDGTIINNTVSVTSTQDSDPKTDRITDTVSTTADINVVKEGPLRADVGDTLVYTFTVTNAGDTLLGNVQVVDDRAGPATYVSGDNGDDRLDLTEAWVYTGSYTVQAGDPDILINTVSVTARDALNTEVTDTDQHRTGLGPPILLPIILKDAGG